MPAPPVVAIVSPGEMGHAIGAVLVHHGLRVMTDLTGRSQRTRQLAASAGLEDVASLDRLVNEADLLLSVLPSAAAPALAAGVAARLAAHPRPLTFVECNALAPATVVSLTEPVGQAGAQVVDIGIVGSPPTLNQSPRFYASGPAIAAVMPLNGYGLDVRPIGPTIGQASGLKMCYAALTKGLSALGTELLLTAAQLDLLAPLLAELQASQASLLGWLERAVPAMPSKARRWVSEMEEIAATFEQTGQSPGYHQAAAQLFRWVGATPLGAIPPEARQARPALTPVINSLAETAPRSTATG